MLYSLSIAGGALVVLAWAYLLLGRGWFWRVGRNLFTAPGTTSAVRIVAVVPARNEAASIGASVTSLLNQDGCDIHVFLVDDASTDGTAQVAREAALCLGKSEELTVIPGRPLPPGWSGKLWAVQQGVAAATALNPRFFLLTDADVVHALCSVSALAAAAQTGGHDLTSLMVKLHCRSVPEKLLIPAFVFFFLKLYPPTRVADRGRATAGAAGGCILIRPEALAHAGGIEAIRSEIIDDCALARSVKRSGGRVWLGLSPSTCSVRRYGSFAEIGRTISRTAFNQLGHSALLLGLTVIGMAIVYLVPVALLFSGHALPVALGAAACAIMVGAYIPMVTFYGLNLPWAFTLPAAALFYTGAMIKSALDFWSGRGGQWKGRAQDIVAKEGRKGAVTP